MNKFLEVLGIIFLILLLTGASGNEEEKKKQALEIACRVIVEAGLVSSCSLNP